MNTGGVFEQAAAFGLLAAISPQAMVIAALYLVSARPGRSSLLYVAGGLVTATVVGIVVLVLIRAGGLSRLDHFHHQTRYGLRLGLGVLALAVAFLLWRRQLRQASRDKTPQDKPEKPKRPSLVKRLAEHPHPFAAFAVGAVMFGPSLTFISAVQVVATAKASIGITVGALVMVVVLNVAFAWLPLIAYLVAPRRTVALLERIQAWLTRHGKTIITVVVAVVGVLLIIQGSLGLT